MMPPPLALSVSLALPLPVAAALPVALPLALPLIVAAALAAVALPALAPLPAVALPVAVVRVVVELLPAAPRCCWPGVQRTSPVSVPLAASLVAVTVSGAGPGSHQPAMSLAESQQGPRQALA